MPKRRANGEGSIFKRKDGLWAAQYTDLNGKKRYLCGKTQQIVKDKLKDAIRQNDSGVVVNYKKMTLSEWVKEWLETYRKSFIRISSYKVEFWVWREHVDSHFHNVQLKDVSSTMIQKFINKKMVERTDGKPGGYSISTVEKIAAVLKASLEKAAELGLIAADPTRKLRIPRRSTEQKNILTIEQQGAFQKALEKRMQGGYEYHPYILLLVLNTGLRIGEATGLKVDDIDFDKMELAVRRTVTRTF